MALGGALLKGWHLRETEKQPREGLGRAFQAKGNRVSLQ